MLSKGLRNRPATRTQPAHLFEERWHSPSPSLRGSSLRYTLREAPIAPALISAGVLALTAVGGLAEITGTGRTTRSRTTCWDRRCGLREGVIRPILDNSTTAFPAIPDTLFAAL
jgi:hypothetical protein